MEELQRFEPKSPAQIEEATTNELSRFLPEQQKAVHMYLTGSYRIKEIAEIVGFTSGTIRKWLRLPAVQQYIEVIQKEEDELVKQSLKAIQMKALYRLSDLVDSSDEMIALQAVKDVLNRNNHVPIQRKEIDITHKTFEEKLQDLDKIVVIDAEFSED